MVLRTTEGIQVEELRNGMYIAYLSGHVVTPVAKGWSIEQAANGLKGYIKAHPNWRQSIQE
jgi:hypothetical protein